MKHYTTKFLLILTIIGFLYGCKKDGLHLEKTSENEIPKSNLKEWYAAQCKIGQPNYQITSFFLKAGLPKWEETKYSLIEKNYATPVDVLSRAGCYKFLVTKTDDKGLPISGKYVYVLVNNEHADLISRADISINFLAIKSIPAKFSGDIIEYDLQHQLIATKHFKNGIISDSERNEIIYKPKGKDKNDNTSNTQQQVCTDYYLATFEYDILISATYLFTSCVEGEGNGGGGGINGGNACNFSSTQGDNIIAGVQYENLNLDYSPLGAATTNANGVIRAPRTVHWQFLSLHIFGGYTLLYSSIFSGIVYKQNASEPKCRWESIAYTSYVQSGGDVPPCMAVNANVYGSAAINTASKLSAQLDIAYYISLSVSCLYVVKVGTHNGSNTMIALANAEYNPE